MNITVRHINEPDKATLQILGQGWMHFTSSTNYSAWSGSEMEFILLTC